MTNVLVERHMDEPLSELELFRMSEAGQSCLELHRVRWDRSLLSADARELICHFDAADLESVRMVLRAQSSQRAEVWPCTLRDAPGLDQEQLARANVFASWRFNEPIALEELDSIDASAAVCLTQSPCALTAHVHRQRSPTRDLSVSRCRRRVGTARPA